MFLKHLIEKLLKYDNLSMLSFSLLNYTAFYGAKLHFNYGADPKNSTSSNILNQKFYYLIFRSYLSKINVLLCG